MATRSNIGIINEDNTVKGIYAHWDGYPSNNGKILVENYKSLNKILGLIDNGSVSILAPEVGEPHPFDFRNSRLAPEKEYIHQGPGYSEGSFRYYAYPVEDIERWENMCLFYHRDRGEDWEHTKPRTFESVESYLANMEEYAYLFKGGEWLVSDGNNRWEGFIPVEEAIRLESVGNG